MHVQVPIFVNIFHSYAGYPYTHQYRASDHFVALKSLLMLCTRIKLKVLIT